MVTNIRPPHPPDVQHVRQPVSDSRSVVSENGRVTVSAESPGLPIPTREKMEQAAARVTEVLRGTTSRLEIEIDDDLHKVVIKVLNEDSGEVIRQIPAQELLDLAKHLDEPKGLFLRERA